jgi:hypothetical protein
MVELELVALIYDTKTMFLRYQDCANVLVLLSAFSRGLIDALCLSEGVYRLRVPDTTKMMDLFRHHLECHLQVFPPVSAVLAREQNNLKRTVQPLLDVCTVT